MGFPVGYTEVYIPKLLIHALSFLGFIRSLIITLFSHLGLSDFLETEVSQSSSTSSSSSSSSWSNNPTRFYRSASLIRELLPVVKFEDLAGEERSSGESCAVCLYEVEGGEEIRWLKNCRHIFHRDCIDRWLDHDRDTCPLCRSPLVPDDLREEFKQRFWDVLSDANDYNHEFLYLEYYSSSVPVL